MVPTDEELAIIIRRKITPDLPRVIKDLVEKPDFCDYFNSLPDDKLFLYLDYLDKIIEGYQAFKSPEQYNENKRPPGLLTHAIDLIYK